MRRSEQINIWIFRIAAVLLCLTVMSVWGTSRLYARYSTTASGSDGARVALWGSSQTIQLANSNTLPKQPGQSCSYTLTVTNKRESGDISEVAQKYSIQVVTAGNLPLTYTLTRNGTKIGTYTETTSKPTWTVAEDDMAFAAGTAGTDSYVLTVTWPGGENSPALASIPDYIEINVCSEQVD